MSYKKKVSILGVTGSIGQSAIDVVLASPECFDVHCVTANTNVLLLADSAIKLRANKAVIADECSFGELQGLLAGHDIEVLSGAQAIGSCAGEKVDIVLAAIMGFAGLRPIIRALEAGVNVAVANKEPLVAAGDYIMELARKSGSKILPVDSEHNAIFQVFEEHNSKDIDKIILTASGGPFLNKSAADVYNSTPAQAIAHPNWTMGKKISVDSATMMNKALEIIEAHYLFNMPAEKIDVIIHPQSVVHSMVSYLDGSVLAQMGASDMRTPIAYAFAWPQRIESGGDKLDVQKLSELTFQSPDLERFPALTYAYKCLNLGSGACIALNAANEVAVELFLDEKIQFGQIITCVGYAVDELYPVLDNKMPKTVEDIEELDKTVRQSVLHFAGERLA